MEIKKGIGVSPGVVVGTAVVLDAENIVVPKRQIVVEQLPAEVERFKTAIAKSKFEFITDECCTNKFSKSSKIKGRQITV